MATPLRDIEANQASDPCVMLYFADIHVAYCTWAAITTLSRRQRQQTRRKMTTKMTKKTSARRRQCTVHASARNARLGSAELL